MSKWDGMDGLSVRFVFVNESKEPAIIFGSRGKVSPLLILVEYYVSTSLR